MRLLAILGLWGCAGAPSAEVGIGSPAAAVDLDPDPDVLHVRLRAARAALQVAGTFVEGFAYEGQVPGPTLRAKVGDTLVVDLENGLGSETTIHWHGLRVPFSEDGAGWQGDAVPPGGERQYRFVLDRAGTFWYHPHLDADRQVDLGLYGALIVEDPADPDVPDTVLIFDAWGESAEEEAPVEGHDHGAHAPPSTWTVNGVAGGALRTGGRARVLNVANAAYLALRWPGARVIGGEQGLAAAVTAPELVVLAPGERVDLEVTTPATVLAEPWTPAGGGEGEPVEVLRVEAEAEPVSWPVSGAAPSADPPYTDITWTFTGDPHTGVWLIDGEAWPDVTPERLALGAEAVIEVRNLSPTRHPFHLHGAPFEVLSINGVPPAFQTIEDTVDVPIHGRVRLLLVADNPGRWMAHCHLLPHAHGGMMTVLDVE